MRGLAIFLVTFVALMAAATTFSGRYNAQCLGSEKLDLPPGRVLVTSGLRDADTVLLKLRLIDSIKRPDVGIFGPGYGNGLGVTTGPLLPGQTISQGITP